jgi:hypothetical protein
LSPLSVLALVSPIIFARFSCDVSCCALIIASATTEAACNQGMPLPIPHRPGTPAPAHSRTLVARCS